MVGARCTLLAVRRGALLLHRLRLARALRAAWHLLQRLTQRARSLNLLTVAAPDELRAVTDPAAVVLADSAPGSAELAASAAGDLPLSDVCTLLYGSPRAERKSD